MKKEDVFGEIDFNKYNKPPFLQQWLTGGDVQRLVSYYDARLNEIIAEMGGLGDGWDLDTVTGIFLGKIGKLLDEPRAGDTDELYRIRLKLRLLINASDGSVNSIISVLKFFFNAETIQLTSRFPAGLFAIYYGENIGDVNFNAILNEVIPAGVLFGTEQIYAVTEEPILVSDTLKLTIKLTLEDKTYTARYRDGTYYRDGTITHRGNQTILDQLTIEEIV